MAVFFGLQTMDVPTTLIGLRLGASEATIFVGRKMQLGPVAGLFVAKAFAVILVSAALGLGRPRIIVLLHYWFTALVAWNLATIFASVAARR